MRSLLNHATNGYCIPDFIEAKAMGYDGWLEWQLDHEGIDDSPVDQLLGAYPTLTMTNPDLYELYFDDVNTVVYELQEALLLRSIYSRKQLYERMVEFWTDHFNIDQRDDFALWFKTRDDYRVARKNALGNFPEMLKTSPRSAAMLWYLDNWDNRSGAVQENYARELLELHTLGVNGPYTEQDVKEVARCFTGWTISGFYYQGPVGVFAYLDQYHDQGQKTVLGHNIPANGGEADGDAVLDILAMHPSTAEHISTKMARWLLGYEPDPGLVQRLTGIYLSSGGEIKPMVREILSRQTLGMTPLSAKRKLRRPFHHLTSLMRATQTSSANLLELTAQLQLMGQTPYWFPTPDGYPDTELAWARALHPRWEWTSRLLGYDLPFTQPNVQVLKALMDLAPPGLTIAERVDYVLTGGDSDPVEVAWVQAFIDNQTSNPNVVLREAFALIAQGPSFQHFS